MTDFPPRVLVIGCGGSGKSTLTRRIGEQTNLPVIHLDTFFWRPGWQAVAPDEWKTIVDDLVARPQWVMDGNYGGTMPHRFKHCDAVIFLDFPTTKCLWRVVKRRFTFARQSRPDMTVGCDERLTWEFLRYILFYRKTRRPKIMTMLAELAREKRVVILRNPAEVEHFTNNLFDMMNGGRWSADQVRSLQ